MFGIVFQQISAEVLRILAVITLILAVLQIFLGYKLIHFWISLAGFLAGFIVGSVVVDYFAELPKYVPLVVGACVGVLFAFLAYKLYLVGLFVYCGFLALAAALNIPFPRGEGWDYLALLVYLLAFLAAGMLSIRFERPLIILITTVTGSVNAVSTLQKLTTVMPEESRTAWIVLVALTGAGLLIQFLTTKETRSSRPRRRSKSRSSKK